MRRLFPGIETVWLSHGFASAGVSGRVLKKPFTAADLAREVRRAMADRSAP